VSDATPIAVRAGAVMLELPIVRLQVQTDRIKPGRAPWRTYRPEVLREVDALIATADGVIGVDGDGTEHIDVHHRAHPHTRDRKGLAGISIMTTGDYAALRARYGLHLADGMAGESILLDHPAGLAGRDLPATMTLRRADGEELALTGVHVAEPCVEFTRFCLQLPASDRVGDDVRQGLLDLGRGARGYKMVAARSGVAVRRGDTLRLCL
jgi:hypothetical protein